VNTGAVLLLSKKCSALKHRRNVNVPFFCGGWGPRAVKNKNQHKVISNKRQGGAVEEMKEKSV
jgi:hypothetical protein